MYNKHLVLFVFYFIVFKCLLARDDGGLKVKVRSFWPVTIFGNTNILARVLVQILSADRSIYFTRYGTIYLALNLPAGRTLTDKLFEREFIRGYVPSGTFPHKLHLAAVICKLPSYHQYEGRVCHKFYLGLTPLYLKGYSLEATYFYIEKPHHTCHKFTSNSYANDTGFSFRVSFKSRGRGGIIDYHFLSSIK